MRVLVTGAAGFIGMHTALRLLERGDEVVGFDSLNAVHDLLPDGEVVLVGVNIEDTEANALAHLAEFAVPYLSVFDPVNELASRFEGIGARTIPSTVFVDPEGRVTARVLGITDAREIAALASVLLPSGSGVS